MKRKNKGFTIVEILVVIILLSVLATFVVPRMFSVLGGERIKLAKSKMSIVQTAIGRFYIDCGRMPVDIEEILVCPSEMEGKWRGPYLKESNLLDPWGNRYVYIQNSDNPDGYDLISLGADGMDGGDGENADIYND